MPYFTLNFFHAAIAFIIPLPSFVTLVYSLVSNSGIPLTMTQEAEHVLYIVLFTIIYVNILFIRCALLHKNLISSWYFETMVLFGHVLTQSRLPLHL